MDPKTVNIPQAAAHDYVGMAQGYLEQNLGRECEFKELSEFAEIVGSTVLGSMYAMIREKEGKEKSEAWLKKAMAAMSGAIRLAGADALVKTDLTIKDMPNRMVKREDLNVAHQNGATTAPAETEKCSCPGDVPCFTCSKVVSSCVSTAFKNTMDMVKVGTKLEALCKSCKSAYGDEAISRLIPEMIQISKSSDKSVSMEQIAGISVQLGMTLGVKAMPLTQAALKEAIKE